MASVNWNNMVKPLGADYNRKSFIVDTDGTDEIKQGEMVYHVSGVLKALDTDAHAADFVGVASDASFIQPYADKKYQNPLVVLSGGIFKFKTTAGDTLTHGAAVYIGADAQTITTTAGGGSYPMGKVYNPDALTLTGGTDNCMVSIEAK